MRSRKRTDHGSKKPKTENDEIPTSAFLVNLVKYAGEAVGGKLSA